METHEGAYISSPPARKRFSDIYRAISWLREYANCIVVVAQCFSLSALDMCPCPCFVRVFESNSLIPEPGWHVKPAMIDKPAF